eukprot:Sspe_Gene.88563::Locus_60550_Transcript_1_1_Confidence_1.000_Length_1689::g.88563::m.88563
MWTDVDDDPPHFGPDTLIEGLSLHGASWSGGDAASGNSPLRDPIDLSFHSSPSWLDERALPLPSRAPLRSVTAEQLGCTVEELEAAFVAQPPSSLQPEHANRKRLQDGREKGDRATTREVRARVAGGAKKLRWEYVELFLRCFIGKQVARDALDDLREFVFSVPPETAEAHQIAARDVYTRELQTAVAQRRKSRGVPAVPVIDGEGCSVLAALRVHLACFCEFHHAVLRERDKDLFPFQLPHHHFLFPPGTLRVVQEIALRNPTSRTLRYWFHDQYLPSPKPYDFHALCDSSGHAKKKDKAMVHLSLILPPDVAKKGAQELMVLESEFGFRYFLSVSVAATEVGRGVEGGVVLDTNGYHIPAPLAELRRAALSAGVPASKLFGVGVCPRELVGRYSRHHKATWVEAFERGEGLGKCDPMVLGSLLLVWLDGLPQRVLGRIESNVKVDHANPLEHLDRLHPSNQQVALWLFHFLCETHGNPRLLSVIFAPILFHVPDGLPFADHARHLQLAAQLFTFLLTRYNLHLYTAPTK